MYFYLEGKRHDSFMLAQSGLLHQLQTHCFTNKGLPFCLYGDLAYPLRLYLQAPFRNANLTEQMKEFNQSMSKGAYCSGCLKTSYTISSLWILKRT